MILQSLLVDHLMIKQFQKDIKLLPFDVVNKNNKPYFKILHKNELHEYSAEEISSMVLTKMKQTAESYLGEKISKASNNSTSIF